MIRTTRFALPLLAALILAVGVGTTHVGPDHEVTTEVTTAAYDGPILVGRPAAPDDAPVGVDVAETSADDARAHEPEADDARDAGETDDAHMRDGRPLTADHPLVAAVIEVQDRHTRSLMRHPNVVGTGTGLDARGQVAVIIFVREATTGLPAFLEGVPTEVVLSGDLIATGRPSNPGGNGNGNGKDKGDNDGETTPDVDPTARFDHPVPIGVSMGHPDITAGTIGCLVEDTSGDHYILTNNHVAANENEATVGDAAIQPGTYDGGITSTDSIGVLHAYVPLDFSGSNEVDAALVRVNNGGDRDVDAATPADGYGAPSSSTVSAALDMGVRKYGRTTGETTGRVYALNATLGIGYDGGVAEFVDQIVISPGKFSAGGDSGSLIVEQNGDHRPVGLLFAGSRRFTIANPIGAVLGAFTFEITVVGD